MKRFWIVLFALVLIASMSEAQLGKKPYVGGKMVEGDSVKTNIGARLAGTTTLHGPAIFNALATFAGGIDLGSVVTSIDDDTLTVAQTGSFVIATASGGSTTISLPTPSASTNGVLYIIAQTANQNLLIKSTVTNGNAIVCDGVSTTDLVTFSTATHLIGAGAICFGTSTKWYVFGLNAACPPVVEAAD